MNSKLTIKLVAVLALFLTSFANINGQIDVTNIDAVAASVIPGATRTYKVPVSYEVYYWTVSGGVFQNGQTNITVTGTNTATVTWSNNCDDYSNGGYIGAYFGSIGASPVGSLGGGFDSPGSCSISCSDLQNQINTITNNTSLTILQQVNQIEAIINANPLCDLKICQ